MVIGTFLVFEMLKILARDSSKWVWSWSLTDSIVAGGLFSSG